MVAGDDVFEDPRMSGESVNVEVVARREDAVVEPSALRLEPDDPDVRV